MRGLSRFKSFFAVCLVLSMGAAGCSDDDNQGTNNNNTIDASLTDAETLPDGDTQDGQAIDGGAQDSGPAQGCTDDPPAEPQAMGGCCTADEDCTDGYCLGGWCTLGACQEDTDCEPTAPGPFVTGTSMMCNTNDVGFLSFCAPGSLAPCGAQGDPDCPASEICVLGWNEQAQSLAEIAISGVCVARMGGAGVSSAGEACDEYADGFYYQCEVPGFIMGSCVLRRCTTACDPTNPQNTCPSGTECAGPLALDTGSGTILASGMCVGPSCGIMEFTGDSENDLVIPGSDSACPSGQVCSAGFVTGQDGDTLEMRCVPENLSYGAVGDSCEHAEKFQSFCSNYGLCLQTAPVYNSANPICHNDEECAANEVCAESSSQYLPSRCAPKPDPGFCTSMCRTDADCASYPNETAYCLELSAGSLPNGQDSFIAVCYPESELFETPPVSCATDADCNMDEGEGCVILSFHSQARICSVLVSVDPAGADCTVGGVGVCQAGEACIDDGAGVFHCTAVSEKGEACVPADAECRAGFCVDSEFDTEDGGNPTNTYCSAACVTSDDCASTQVCENVKLAENDPADENDDVVVGLCRTRMVRTGPGCPTNPCTGGKLCDDITGQCYNPTALWGGLCIDDSDCGQNGICDTSVANGICYLPGCDPANGNADCGGGDTACSQNNVVGVCLEACASDASCTRNSTDGHVCNNGACEAP